MFKIIFRLFCKLDRYSHSTWTRYKYPKISKYIANKVNPWLLPILSAILATYAIDDWHEGENDGIKGRRYYV